jgi:hypothetical protein
MSDSEKHPRAEHEMSPREEFRTRRPFEEPQLTFIEPRLTKHGDATKITQQNGFFGTFVP